MVASRLTLALVAVTVAAIVVGAAAHPPAHDADVLTNGPGNLRSAVHSHNHGHTHAHITGHDGSKVHTFTCGVGHPDFPEIAEVEAEVVHQQYHDFAHPEVQRRLTEHVSMHDAAGIEMDPHMQRAARRMEDQEYDETAGGDFLPLSVADTLGLSANIRITAVWDLIEEGGGDDDDRQCRTAGETVSPFTGAVQCIDCATDNSPAACDAEDGDPTYSDLVSEDLLDMLQGRTGWSSAFLGEALKIKPVKDDDTITFTASANAAVTNVDQLIGESWTDTDLVMIMTARPAPGLNGYAVCLQRDQYGRCTVGIFNWVPGVLSTDTENDPDAISAQRHTSLHETVHVLGGINPDGIFIDENGDTAPFSTNWIEEHDSTHYAKTVTKLKSPKVLALAREHFGCDTMTGVPLEDQSTGKLAHWEARLLGPELMSYGTGTGETIFGDITFAYLEDTNQYIAVRNTTGHYLKGGRLVGSFGDTGKVEEYKVELSPDEDWVPPHDYAPGALTWGRSAGCDFVEGSAADWPSTYFCDENRAYACTHDYRMSAVCIVLAYGQFVSNQFSCGHCVQSGTVCNRNDGATCTATLNDNCPSPGTDCGLPTMFQYFATDSAAQAATGVSAATTENSAGFSSAMDYVPVRLGYWNCQDSKASNGSSLLENQSGGGFSLTSVIGGAADNMLTFGGQAFCPECRCFVSSLKDFSDGPPSPNFPRFGLCYRSNCYKEDYLQFAIESQIGRATTWYKCPPAGGKLYIVGFSGSFHCPVAEDFCKFDTVTGIKYVETDPFWEWVFWGIVAGLPLLFFLACLIPPIRRCCVSRAKVYCGVNHFNRRGELDLDAEVDIDEPLHAPPGFAAKGLQFTNTIVFLLACAAFLMTLAGFANNNVSIAAGMLITLSLTTMVFSAFGVWAATKKTKGTSCVAVVYTYVVFFCIIFYVFAVLYAMLYPAALGKIMENQWPKLRDVFPEGVLSAELNDGDGEALLADNAGAVAAAALIMFLFLAVEFISIVVVITVPVLAATMYSVINWCTLFMGLCMWGIAGYAAQLEDIGPGVAVGLGVFMGFYLIAAAVIELVASHKKTVKWMAMAMFLTCLTMLITLIIAAVIFVAIKDVDALLDRMTDEQLQSLTEALSLEVGGREGIAEVVKNNLRSAGLMGICMVIMGVCLVKSNAIFLHKVRMHWNKERRGSQIKTIEMKPAGTRAAERVQQRPMM